MRMFVPVAMAALGLTVTTADAARPAPSSPPYTCFECEFARPIRYIGTFSEQDGYLATFQNHDIVADLEGEIGIGMGNNRQFDNYFVFDLVVNSQITLTIKTKHGTALAGSWAVELFTDGGTTCGTVTCNFVLPDLNNPILSNSNLTKGFRGKTTLVAGRYIIRIAAGTRATGESAYDGKLVVRPVK